MATKEKPAAQKEARKKDSDDFNLQIDGISCAMCVTNVERALKSVSGVEEASVNMGTSEARVRSRDADVAELIRAVEKAGYGAVQLDDMGAPVDADSAEEAVPSSPGKEDEDGGGTARAREERAEHGDTRDSQAAAHRPQSSRFKRRFWIALPLAAIVFVLDMGPMAIPAWHEWVMGRLTAWNSIQMALTAVILFYTGSSFFTGAWRAARHRSADMNTLVAIGTGAAFLFSTYAVFFGREDGLVRPHDVYFETAAIIIALILLGKWMEERARHRSRDAMTGLLEMAPQRANRLIRGGTTSTQSNEAETRNASTSENGKYETIPVKQVAVGDLLLVRAWEQVPVDGKVVSGHPSIDEAMMTGESVPVEKESGEEVTGGTRNTSTSFVMQATRVGADTALARIIRTVRDAQSSKPPIQRLVDRVASVFVPIVLLVALVTFAAWLVVGSPAQAMVNMVAVLVIACPCALGLATPTGLMVSSGRAAEKGILIKDAVTLEEARKADVVMFDKTGTLTTGVMEVSRVMPLADGETGALSEEDLLSLAAAVEYQSDHPIAGSIVRHAERAGLSLPAAEGVETFMGMGIAGTVDGRSVSVSSHTAWEAYTEAQEEQIGQAQDRGETVLLVRVDERPAGFITVADQMRPEAKSVVDSLRRMRIETVMVTGDQYRNARVVAGRLGIDKVEAGVKPDEKAEIVKSYQQRGKRVAMVGDGINDAAALVQADLGMALSGGTDLAMSSADITLVGEDLGKVVDALELSRGTLRIIRQNLFWAFVYNSFGIPLAALGFLSPMFAAFAMAMSSVSVVTNSLRIRKI
jgi:P-type Cu+ transporter